MLRGIRMDSSDLWTSNWSQKLPDRSANRPVWPADRLASRPSELASWLASATNGRRFHSKSGAALASHSMAARAPLESGPLYERLPFWGIQSGAPDNSGEFFFGAILTDSSSDAPRRNWLLIEFTPIEWPKKKKNVQFERSKGFDNVSKLFAAHLLKILDVFWSNFSIRLPNGGKKEREFQLEGL